MYVCIYTCVCICMCKYTCMCVCVCVCVYIHQGRSWKKPSGIMVGKGLPRWLSGKEYACQYRRCQFDPWVGKIPRRTNGNAFQYSCLENPMDRGGWQATVWGHRVRHDWACIHKIMVGYGLVQMTVKGVKRKLGGRRTNCKQYQWIQGSAQFSWVAQ